MARHRRTKGSSATGADLRTVDAFPGRPPVQMDVRNPAPFGWGPAAFLGTVALIDRVDASLVGGTLKSLQDEFGFNDAVAGFLLSLPSVAALLLVIPAGKLADTRNRRILLTVVVAAWGLFTFGAAIAPTLAAFFLARILLGAATPLNIPASASLIGDLYGSAARTKAFAITRVMEYLGFPIGVALGGIIAGTLGWRWAYVLMGIPAIVMSLVIFFRLREPKRGLGDELDVLARQSATVGPDGAFVETVADTLDPGPENVAHVSEMSTEIGAWQRIKDVLAVPTLRYLVIGQALLFCAFAGAFSFSAKFFADYYFAADGDKGEAIGAAVAGTIGLLGILIGGATASRIGDRYHEIKPAWRITVGGWCLVAAFFCIAILAFVPSFAAGAIALLVVNVGNIIALANLGAVTADVIPASKRGTGFAVAQFLITIGSACGAIIVGIVSSAFDENLRLGIGALIIPLGIGALVILVFARANYESDRSKALAEAAGSTS